MTVKILDVRPLGLATGLGAIIENANFENLNDADFATIHDALYKYNVVILRGQTGMSPLAQHTLTNRFDPLSKTYGHGKTLDAKKSVLHPDLKTCPAHPTVQIIGNGTYDEDYEGLKAPFTLKHPHHKNFHQIPISEEDDLIATRFYRWHIDAALYGLNPPKMTSLLAVKVPAGESQTLRYDDGTGDEMTVPLGTTAFASSYYTYDLLSEEDKKFARESFVEYAAHPYIWMSGARSNSVGLGMVSEGKELTDAELPPIEQEKIKILPMCWKNPVDGRLALQIHPSAIKAIHLADGSTITDLKEVRDIVYRMQRPGIAPELVYAHDWQEGDCVLFNNRGVLHTVVGAFKPTDQRLFRQCNVASIEGVLGPDDKLYG